MIKAYEILLPGKILDFARQPAKVYQITCHWLNFEVLVSPCVEKATIEQK
jgi:hypothetical protein